MLLLSIILVTLEERMTRVQRRWIRYSVSPYARVAGRMQLDT
jgi:hypothetical protein